MAQAPDTIAKLFFLACELEKPDALAFKKDGAYVGISHADVRRSVENLALAMEARGLKAGDRVAILSENRPEWAMADYACAIVGAPLVTIYATLIAPQAAYILKDSGAKWVLCSTRDQLQKVLDQWKDLPDLELAVLMDGEAPGDAKRPLLTWKRLQAEGEARTPERAKVRAWAEGRKSGDPLTLIYTSGTTGEPKGAVLTHGNLVSNALTSLEVLPSLGPRDRALSFLPLTHIFERMAGHYALFHAGISIYYAESVNSVGDDMLLAQPTVLCSVPRIYEKIYARIEESVDSGPRLKRAIFHWAVGVGRQVAPFLYENREAKGFLAFKARWADKLVFSKIRGRTGGRLRFAVSGGAPLSPAIMEFFWSIGLPILEGYGLTETSPVITVNRLGKVKPGSVGVPLYETWDGQPFVKIAEDGEIICRGPNIMQGYWNSPKATGEAIDAEGYFHTGDIGSFDEQGRLSITDRKKELLVTSGGKKVAPQPIENALKDDKYIAQAVLIGDQRNFISALIVPNFPALERWAGYKKLAWKTHGDLIGLPLVYAKLMSRVEKVNETLSSYERIKKIALLDQELTLETDTLTPSLKVKRRVVNVKYGGLIDALYEEHAGATEAH
ncbi:MAG TPA: long-chain fatty acid--CoA ligase [Holophagaceae bacterium]|nr:long-chain fatty acid--CoA ligase [Holophagaceae bacterium]